MTEKVRGRPFQKGASGNPAGRPRSGESIAEYIRQLAGPEGRVYIDKLHALATGEDTDARVLMAAIGVLLERGFGKPPQAIEHSGTIDSSKCPPGQATSRFSWRVSSRR